MYEKLVENWLTSVNELGYQIPFCETLIADGYTILHVSRHGRGEHGKDIVARRDDGVLCSFQLKGGDITLGVWRDIRGEVEELVRLPIRLPGVSETEAHLPHLVTNGEIRGDAIENIKQHSDDWERRGALGLKVWQRGTVLERFINAQGSYLPSRLTAFRDFVNLYVGPFNGQLPKGKLAALLEGLVAAVPVGTSSTKLRRVVASITVVAGYIVGQYAQADNHLAAAEGWVVAAAAILMLAERDRAEDSTYRPTLDLVRLGFERALKSMVDEALGAESFLSGGGLADAMVYGVRTTQIIGWTAYWSAEQRRTGGAGNQREVAAMIRREGSAMQWVGEADWPLRLALVLWLDREGYSSEAESMLIGWSSSIVQRQGRGNGVPSPYWSQEKVLRRQYGLLAPSDNEDFQTHSFTLAQCLDMLVRRLRRQAVAALWPRASRMTLCNYVPDDLYETFSWHTNRGVLYEVLPELTAKWSVWRNRASIVPSDSVPRMLKRHPEWTLPLLTVYPHRATVELTAYADAVYTRRAAIPAEGAP